MVTCLLKNFHPPVVKKWLLGLGAGTIAAFILIRLTNFYGDPHPWVVQNSFTYSILSFLNTTKYPPSLLYILMTLGPAFIFLAYSERTSNSLSRAVIHIGRVPMFYYLIHIYLIHLLAMGAAEISGFNWDVFILKTWPWLEPQLKGYGFSLGVTYLVWNGVVLMLYPLCRWYDGYKQKNKDKKWLSYL